MRSTSQKYSPIHGIPEKSEKQPLTSFVAVASLQPEEATVLAQSSLSHPFLARSAAGTKNADEARDLDQPLKQRFFLQSEDVAGAQARLKSSAAAIQDSEKYIAKKAWPFVQNQLRLEAQYLNFDIDTIASSKSKEEKKAIKALQKSLNAELDVVSCRTDLFGSFETLLLRKMKRSASLSLQLSSGGMFLCFQPCK